LSVIRRYEKQGITKGIMSIKTLYTFEVNKEIEVDKEEKVDGGTLVKKVKSTKPVRFAIRKPNRSTIDSCERFYSVEYNKAITDGLMPRALFAKRLNNDNGIFSEAQMKELQGLYTKFIDIGNDIVSFSAKKPEDRTDEEKKQNEEAVIQYADIQQKLNNYELAKQSIFDNTAESAAMVKAISWYVLFLSYKENDKGEFEPLYKGDSYNEKIEFYDELEEHEDSFLLGVARRLNNLITQLYLGRVRTEEDLKALDDRENSTLGKKEESEEKSEG